MTTYMTTYCKTENTHVISSCVSDESAIFQISFNFLLVHPELRVVACLGLIWGILF